MSYRQYDLITSITEKFPEVGEFFLENGLCDEDVYTMDFKALKASLSDFSAIERTSVWKHIKEWELHCDTPPISPSLMNNSYEAAPSLDLPKSFDMKASTVTSPKVFPFNRSESIPRLKPIQSINTPIPSIKPSSSHTIASSPISSINKPIPSINEPIPSIKPSSSHATISNKIETTGSPTLNILSLKPSPPPNVPKPDETTPSIGFPTLNSTPTPELLDNKLQILSPAFTIYKETELINTENAGGLVKRQIARLVRNTITNMIAELYTYNRGPSSIELEEMAKSLILTYPSLKDSAGTHGKILDKLQKRLYNENASKKMAMTNEIDGKKSARKRKLIEINAENNNNGKIDKQVDGNSKKIKFSLPESQCIIKESAESTESIDQDKENEACDVPQFENDSTEDESEDSPAEIAMERFLALLEKESKKKNPNSSKINFLLNKTFTSRRTFLNEIKQARVQTYINKFPSLKDGVEIVEEVRRLRGLPSTSKEEFRNCAVKRLHNQIDGIIFYGLAFKQAPRPSSSNNEEKLLYVLENCPKIFPNEKIKKKQKNIARIFIEVEDQEDPEKAICKVSSQYPILLLERKSVNLVVNKALLLEWKRESLEEAVVALLGAYYTFNMDYPPDLEIALTMLQWLIFEHYEAPKDIIQKVTDIYNAYTN